MATTTTRTIPLIALRLQRSSVVSATPSSPARPTTACHAASSLAPTTAAYAICGCLTKSHPITVRSVDSVASAVKRTSCTATNVACALTERSMKATTASRASIGQTVPSAKNTSSLRALLHMRCLVDTRFTGTASVSSPRTTAVARSARKRPKRETVCSPPGVPWPQRSPYSQSLLISLVLST